MTAQATPRLNIRGPVVIIVEFISINNTAFCQMKGLQSERTHNNLGPPATKNWGPYNFYRRCSQISQLGSRILVDCQTSRPQSERINEFFYIIFWELPPPRTAGFLGSLYVPMYLNLFPVTRNSNELESRDRDSRTIS